MKKGFLDGAKKPLYSSKGSEQSAPPMSDAQMEKELHQLLSDPEGRELHKLLANDEGKELHKMLDGIESKMPPRAAPVSVTKPAAAELSVPDFKLNEVDE